LENQIDLKDDAHRVTIGKLDETEDELNERRRREQVHLDKQKEKQLQEERILNEKIQKESELKRERLKKENLLFEGGQFEKILEKQKAGEVPLTKSTEIVSPRSTTGVSPRGTLSPRGIISPRGEKSTSPRKPKKRDPGSLRVNVEYPEKQLLVNMMTVVNVSLKDIEVGEYVDEPGAVIEARITDPNGKILTVPSIKLKDPGIWTVRFAPPTLGTYRSMVYFNGQEVQNKFTKIKCVSRLKKAGVGVRKIK